MRFLYFDVTEMIYISQKNKKAITNLKTLNRLENVSCAFILFCFILLHYSDFIYFFCYPQD